MVQLYNQEGSKIKELTLTLVLFSIGAPIIPSKSLHQEKTISLK